MRRFLLLGFAIWLVVEQVAGQGSMPAPGDTVILIKPEEMRIMPKSMLEKKLGMETESAGTAAVWSTKAAESLSRKAGSAEVDKTFAKEQERLIEEAKRREQTTTKSGEELAKSYVAVGTVKFVFDNTTEPFTLFFDGIEQRSRVDLGERGLVRTLQLPKLNRMYRIEFPRSDAHSDRAICIEMRGSRERPIKALKAIPDLSKFERIGEDSIGSAKVVRWRYELKNEASSIHHTFWLFTEVKTKKPVRLEVFARSKQSSKLIDHYLVDFKYFFTTRPSDDIFVKPVDIECRSIVGLSESKEEHDREARPEIDRERLFMNPLASILDPEVHLVYQREFDRLFDGFRRRYNKRYEADELEMRRAAFCHNYRYINLLNRAGLSYKLRINHLADRTNDELRKMLGVRGVGKLDSSTHATRFDAKVHNVRRIDSLPTAIDWRVFGGLTPVTNQGACGSDWAIAAKSVIESAFFLRSNRLVKLSPQELLDCAHETGNHDCTSGTPWQAYEYALKNGIASEFYYGRLVNRKDRCKRDEVPISARIKRWVLVGKDETELKQAVAMNGPVAAMIDAAHKSFFFYSHGIYREANCRTKPEDVNHAVVVAGYGSLNGREYFLLKNSFSNEWGLNGYMLIDANGNQCGILSAPTFVEM